MSRASTVPGRAGPAPGARARPAASLPRALLAVWGLSVRQTAAQRGAWIGRAVLLVLILVIFSRLWQALEQAGALGRLSARDLLWYLALTEWIVIGLPLTHTAIEADVRSGDLAGLLPRPLPWLALRVAEGLGAMTVRFTALGMAAFASALLLGGGLPSEPLGLLLALPLGLLAGVLGTLLYAWVGLSAFWLVDTTPVFWVFQKLCFLLGGLLLPLSIYPAWLRALAEALPFGPLVSGTGSMALGLDPARAALTALKLCGWILLALLLLHLTWRRARLRLDVGGG